VIMFTKVVQKSEILRKNRVAVLPPTRNREIALREANYCDNGSI
jgi:hypothetical protein